MKAIQYRSVGGRPEVVQIDDPRVGPGQVLLKVTASGMCHSDEFVMGLGKEQLPFALPLTLGHEGAGTIEALGEGVQGLTLGDSVVVYGPWGCGRCIKYAQGKENYCIRAKAEGIHPPGLGAPGAMAEYMIVNDPRHLVPLGDLDPVKNVSLTDAGLTPYSAIKASLPKLGAGSTAVVIGAGGLGHVGIQILRALSGATVIALDLNDEKLELARKVGAHQALPSDGNASAGIRDITNGLGADAVFDFVGAQPTVELAGSIAAAEGDVTIVGIGGGALPVGYGTMANNVTVRAPYWGSRSELIEVLDLARSGAIDVEVETYGLDEGPEAYARLHAGKISGRGVIVPNS
ncbi:MAG: NAD(P)-dependent alcohol dehydrogenase [Micrococcaceae bacterium]|nr:NAD(P)-dependent alcohol dehydrogenase [Micrococcaceae bacterium]